MKKFRFLLAASTLLAGLAAAQSASAIVIYANDFETNSTSDLTGGSIQTAPNGQNFYGPLYNGSTATLSLSGLAAHTNVTLTFDLYSIGSVDGNGPAGGGPDPFLVNFQGNNVITTNVANYNGGGNTQEFPNLNGTGTFTPDTAASATNSLGYTGYPTTGVEDSIESISINLPSMASTIEFAFIGDTNEALGNEFYGIDNIFVSTDAVKSSNVPEPITLSLFGAGLAGAAAMRRRKKANKA